MTLACTLLTDGRPETFTVSATVPAMGEHSHSGTEAALFSLPNGTDFYGFAIDSIALHLDNLTVSTDGAGFWNWSSSYSILINGASVPELSSGIVLLVGAGVVACVRRARGRPVDGHTPYAAGPLRSTVGDLLTWDRSLYSRRRLGSRTSVTIDTVSRGSWDKRGGIV